MARRKEQYNKLIQALDKISENSEITAKGIRATNKKLSVIKTSTDQIKRSRKSKLELILEIIALIITVSGLSIFGIYKEFFKANTSQYEIYLHSEYNKIAIYQETDITATLNFDADIVSITAHLASGKSEKLKMSRKNQYEWQKKVFFNEIGIHRIVVTTRDPNGNILEDTIEVDVIPFT